MQRVVSGALLVLFPSCRDVKPSPPAPAAAVSLAAAPSSSASVPLLPTLLSDHSMAGLRVRSGTLGGRSSWGFSDIGLDSAKIRLEIVVAARGAPLERLLPEGALAIVNGGYFEADFRPSTWLKQGGVELSRKTDTSKGGVLAIGAAGVAGAYLGPFSGLRFEPELAVQSFPLIVEVDGRPGINRDDGRRAARTVVCWSEGQLHFVVIAAPRGEGPTLFESVALLREPWPAGFGCRAALNLDGGPSSGVWFSPQVEAKQRPPFAPVAYGIALMPR